MACSPGLWSPGTEALRDEIKLLLRGFEPLRAADLQRLLRAALDAQARKPPGADELDTRGPLEEHVADVLTTVGDGIGYTPASEIAQEIASRWPAEETRSARRINNCIKGMRERHWPIESTKVGHRIPPGARERLPAPFRAR